MNDDDRIPDCEPDEIIETEAARLRHYRSPEAYLAEHKWETGRSLSTTLAVLIESISDVDATDRPPLFTKIDMEALDRLFEPIGDGEQSCRTGRVVFPYSGFLVRVHADGKIVIRPKQEDAER